MIQDNKMAKLVATEKANYAILSVWYAPSMSRGVSTVLVIGGAGDYFDVADHVC
jgi:predicted ABC-class ATPase